MLINLVPKVFSLARKRPWERGWMLIAGFPDDIWMLQQPKEEIVAFSKKKKQFSKSSDKTSSTTGSSAAMFLTCDHALLPCNFFFPVPLPFFYPKKKRPPDRRLPCFLLTRYVPRPRPTGIRKFRSNDTVQSISFP